jgi:DNA polymerase-3 subunit delta'
MSWQGVHGHDHVVEWFRRGITRHRLASTFLFLGPPGIGKRTFALRLAQSLLCDTHPEEELAACGHCPACVQVAAHSHPDLILVGKPKDKNFIPVETFIGDRDHRMQQGLCHDISLKPFCGGRKIAIIDDADLIKNPEGSNCLLKTLEEPPPRSLLILIGTSEQKQLPTIRSRSQVVRFNPLPADIVATLLLEQQVVDDRAEAERLATLSQGSLQRARLWTDSELCEFRDQMLAYLSDPAADTVRFTRDASAFVDAAGKDAPPRRERLRLAISFAADFYRQLMFALAGVAVEADPALARSIQTGARSWPAAEEAAGDCLERCLDALAHVDANANLATLVECWLDDVAALARGESLSTSV